VCGIVAVAARRDCSEILLEGLRRLEYRGYDSAGFAVIDREGQLSSHKTLGRVAALEAGTTGDATERWHRHCAHPLGDPRRPVGCQRPPSCHS
jgi:glucosamine--fructose-6-phosphate aminotransferase (isomerizing)